MGRDGGTLQWRAIAEVLADEDLIGITDGNPDPIEEYRPEAEDIDGRIRRDPGASVAQIVISVFEHWFEAKIEMEDAERIAARIEKPAGVEVGLDTKSRREPEQFEAEIFRTVRQIAQPTVEAGLARLDEGVNGGGRHLKLDPVNPKACSLTVYPEYPTLALSEGTTEMFGREDDRLRDLALIVRAVIAGRYEWEYGKARAFRVIPMKRFKGTFHTDDGPWTFTRWGTMEAEATRGTYEPY